MNYDLSHETIRSVANNTIGKIVFSNDVLKADEADDFFNLTQLEFLKLKNNHITFDASAKSPAVKLIRDNIHYLE
jgi:hypothetical protein